MAPGEKGGGSKFLVSPVRRHRGFWGKKTETLPFLRSLNGSTHGGAWSIFTLYASGKNYKVEAEKKTSDFERLEKRLPLPFIPKHLDIPETPQNIDSARQAGSKKALVGSWQKRREIDRNKRAGERRREREIDRERLRLTETRKRERASRRQKARGRERARLKRV